MHNLHNSIKKVKSLTESQWKKLAGKAKKIELNKDRYIPLPKHEKGVCTYLK